MLILQDSQDAFEAQTDSPNIVDDTLTKIDQLIYKILGKVSQQAKCNTILDQSMKMI